jgi:hypothetical protein
MIPSRVLRNAAALVLVLGLSANVPADQPKESVKAKDDSFEAGAVYKGKLTQKGEFPPGGVLPPELDTTLTVTKRDGAAFEGELNEKTDTLDVTYHIRGRVIGDGRINWEAHAVKQTNPGTIGIPKCRYTGTVKGKVITGSWKYPSNDEGISLAGEFKLELP